MLFGGKSTEHEVSLQSSINLIQAINRQKYELVLIGVDKQGRWMLCNEQDYLINREDPTTISLSIVPPARYLAVVPGTNTAQLIYAVNGQPLPAIDVVFSVLHGACGEDGSVQGLLRVLNIPYAGPEVLASAVCLDKDMTKRVLRDAGVPVTPSVTLWRDDYHNQAVPAIVATMGLPLFIKPASQGSSVGVSLVHDLASFDPALSQALSYDTKVLVEPAMNGLEIETAVLGNRNELEVSVCGEIVANDAFYTYNTKYINRSKAKFIIPAQLEPLIEQEIRQIARYAYRLLGCSVMARVDFLLTKDRKIMLNEVNTLPGLTSLSIYPKLWEASGLDYPNLVERLINLALARDGRSLRS